MTQGIIQITEKHEVWIVDGWIHPKAGGDDYQFKQEVKIRPIWSPTQSRTASKLIENDKKVANILINHFKRKLKKQSEIINDFVVYKKGSNKIYSASVVKK